ncbi:MFS transporter [Lactiplantibacillus pingfangensis]|uniref:MFS transporter n=1 Tax=Lactiplantibacillus pingfangensis TaxID=2559915 RepID=UPI0010F4D9D5|nr:MFS transporter [Lactiplantibacillus pingfangensis]
MSDTHDKRDTLIFKVSLLSSTFLITGVSATSALLPSLRTAFPAVSKQTLQSFLSLPALPQFIALLMAGFLATKLGKKRVILLGALLWTISGTIPLFMHNFNFILVSRLFLGFSLGLIQPIGTSMIADFYEGEIRNTLMGIQSAVIGVSGTVLTYAIGILIGLNWRYAFLIYLVGLLVFLLTFIYLPKEIQNQADTVTQQKVAGSTKLGKEVIWWVVLTLFFNLGQNAITLDFNLAVVEEHVANATGAANMMVAYSILGLLTGLSFGIYMKFAKQYGGIIAATLFLAGNVLVAVSATTVTYYLAMILAGAGFGLFMPYMFTAVNTHTTAANSAYATSATTAAASFANFLAPYVYGLLAHLFNNNTSQFSFYFGSAFTLILLIGLIYLYQAEKKPSQKSSKEQLLS